MVLRNPYSIEIKTKTGDISLPVFLWILGLNAYIAFIASSPLLGTFYAPPTRFWELAVGGILAATFYRADPIWNKLSFFLEKNINSLIYAEKSAWERNSNLQGCSFLSGPYSYCHFYCFL